MRLQDKPASFIGKLCNILRSKQYAKIVAWDSQHKGIRILDQKRLEETILPKYFRHSRFSSFVRQLNMYDFHKVHLEDHRSIFLHDSFNPKNKENIHLIRRKITPERKEENIPNDEESQAEIERYEKENFGFCDQMIKTSRAALFDKSSIKVLCTDSMNLIFLSKEEAFTAIMAELLPLIKDKTAFEGKKKQLRRDKRYGNYIKQNKFMRELYARMGLNMDEQQLLQLSIEDELLFHSKKSLPPKSLRMLQSGQLNYCYKRDTIGHFLNI